MKSSWLLSFAFVMTISSIVIAAAASVAGEIYDSRSAKLNGIGEELNSEKGEQEKQFERLEIIKMKYCISNFSPQFLMNNDIADKRTFFVGSRYGRSQSDLMNMDGKSSSVRIVPRNDRYFFGSRYGKRSMMPVVMPIASAGPIEDQNQSMSCFYTGIANLFRCVERGNEDRK